jgi:hydroxyacylglutathione hydrolase
MKRIKCAYYFLLLLRFFTACTKNDETITINEVKWIHGSSNCQENRDVPIQVIKYNASTWILRQNKCIHYEAPLMYLFMGNNKALLVDTGATADSTTFPLHNTVMQIVEDWQHLNKKSMSLVVAHSHNHDDHYAADSQFKDQPNTTIVGLSCEEVSNFFGLSNWPNQSATYDLGDRPLTIIPIPGHEASSIAVYDEQTQILLTGDSFYPGRLYIRDWTAYKKSISRLTQFCENNPVKWLLGNHIEMKDSAKRDYVTGTTYQPHEQKLALTVEELQLLNQELYNLGDTPVYKSFDKFILVPKPISEISIASEAITTLALSGYPDFLAADGEEVWVTNVDTVQKLSSRISKPILTASAPGICGAPVVAFGSLWAASCKNNSVMRIDGTTGKIMANIPCGVADPEGEISLAVGAGSIWILSDKKGVLSRIDPTSNQLVAEISVMPHSFCAAFGFDAVWITNTNSGNVQRIDPITNNVVATINVGPTPRFLAVGEQGVWTLNQGDGTISRIDPTTNKTVAIIEGNAPGIGGDIATGNGRVWVRAKNGRMLQSINSINNEVEKVYGPLNGSGAVRVAGQNIWVTAHDVNKIWVIQ